MVRKKPTPTDDPNVLQLYEETASKELQKLVKEGKAEIILVMGPPRCGTTATEKFLMGLDVDAQLNEPRIRRTENDFQPNSKAMILEKVQALHRQGIEKPRIIVKHTSRFIKVGGEMEYWKDICKHIVLLVRNPALCMESQILLHMNAFERHDLNIDRRLTKVTRSPEVKGDEPVRDRWIRYIKKAEKERDYSELREIFAFNMLAKAEFWKNKPYVLDILAECLKNLDKRQGRDYVDECFAHSVYERREMFWSKMRNPEIQPSIEWIPDFLLDELIGFRVGSWISMQRHYDDLKKGGGCDFSVVDFSDIQLNPGKVLRQLSKKMDVPLRKKGAIQPQFDVDEKGRIWDSKYSPFTKVMAHDAIQPPDKTPIPLKNYPEYIQDIFPDAMSTYIDLLKDPHRVSPVDDHVHEFVSKKLPKGKSFSETDPVTAYVHSKVADKGDLSKAVRAQYPEYGDYFRMVDKLSRHTARAHSV